MIPDIMRIPTVVMATLAPRSLPRRRRSLARLVLPSKWCSSAFAAYAYCTYFNVKEVGQIYIPAVNWGLFIAIAFAVVMFKSSDALAAAYGTVCTDMLITTILTFFVIRWRVEVPISALYRGNVIVLWWIFCFGHPTC